MLDTIPAEVDSVDGLYAIPASLMWLWVEHDNRFVIVEGGRGGGKSWGVADRFVEHALESEFPPFKLGCFRQFQNSIDDSSKELIESAIRRQGVQDKFRIYRDSIVSATGNKIVFLGMDRMASSIKSKENVKYVWVDEAQDVSTESLRKMMPTIRRDDAILYFTLNPEREDQAVYAQFLGPHRIYGEDTVRLSINHFDTPFFPKSLRRQMEAEFRADPLLAEHTWNGALMRRGNALVFQPEDWEIDTIDLPDGLAACYGLDIGVTAGTTACVKCWYWQEAELFYVQREIGHKGSVPSHRLGEWLGQIVEEGSTIRSDHQTLIGNVAGRRSGFKVIHALKGQNSVTEGVEWLKGRDRFVVHPSCAQTIHELNRYSYKVNKQTGDVNPFEIEKENDHFLDAIRYSAEPVALARSKRSASSGGWTH